MKYVTFFFVSLLVLWAVDANAGQAVISFQGRANFLDPTSGGSAICINDAPSGLAFASCSSSSPYPSGLTADIYIVPGPAGSSYNCGPSDCTVTQYPLAGGSYSISFFSGAPNAAPDSLGNGPLITGGLDASGAIAWSPTVPELDSVGFEGTLGVSSISPALLTDLGLSGVQTGWAGTFGISWSGFQGGGTVNLLFSAPDTPSTVPEPGTLILLGLGLAVVALVSVRDRRQIVTQARAR